MLCLSNINIRFKEKTIFHQAEFCSYPYQLTLIIGKSGIGKSTLIQTILFQHHCLYCFNDNDYSNLNEEEQSAFISQYIGTVSQEPSFINDLTIAQNIDFVMESYNLTNRKTDLIKMFELDNLMDKYPLQLSGGEKMRVSIYLTALKDPYIFILDEPTASLDNNNKTKVIHFLKNYAQQGHIVIVATHDNEMINNGDRIYKIKNKALHLIQDNEGKADIKDNVSICQLYQMPHLFKVYKQINKHHFIINKLLLLILSVSIAFVFISLSLNNVIIKQTKDYLNEFSSREIIVYQSIFSSRDYTFDGREFPIESEIIDKVKTIDGVENVYERVDLALSDVNYYYSGENGEEGSTDGIITSFQNNQKLNSMSFKDELWIHTYIDDFDYSNQLSKVYNNEGIYISEPLFQSLFDNKEVNNPSISLELPIPIYNSTGISELNDYENNEESAPCNTITSLKKHVQLPIKGIIKGNVLGQEDSSYTHHIYISQSYMKSMINKYAVTQDRTIYANYDTFVNYINNKPKDFTSSQYQVVHQTVWQPNAYTVILSDLSKMNSAVSEIKKIGLSVESSYFDASAILYTNEQTKNTLTIISLASMSIILIIYLVIQYTRLETTLDTSFFLKCLGYNKKMLTKFHSKMNMYRVYYLFALSIIFYFLIRFILEKTMIAYIQINPLILLVMFILIFTIEYLYQRLLMRIKK